MARPRVPLGISEFRSIREQGLTYIDKSLLIRDVLEAPAQVMLVPRPRRFGKTLGLSLLRTYLEKAAADSWPLFSGLAIAGEDELRARHFGRYPVVAMTFKDIKARTWANCRAAMARLLAEAYREHRYLLTSEVLTPEDAALFQAILRGEASDAQLWTSLRDLTTALSRHHRQPVVILIDEYDTPIHGAYVAGYYDEAIEFFRNFLSGGLKDNPHLYKGVLTGILRIAKDSIFTGLNNIDVYSILRGELSAHFGFSEEEVQALLEAEGRPDLMDEVRRWYNGYVFGGRLVYNPWSVLSFIGRQDKIARPYWVETSSNDLVRELLVEHGLGLSSEMEVLLSGGTIEVPLSEHVALREVRDRSELVWSLLLFTGYLKVVEQRVDRGKLSGSLALPNLEVTTIYEDMFRAWTNQGTGGDRERKDLIRAFLTGDAETVRRRMERWIDSSVSFYDTARHNPPERFYHGFVLGLLVGLGPTHEVSSNAESGYGRCDAGFRACSASAIADVMVAPRQAGQPGCVLELKVRDPERETVEQALDGAQAQLRDRAYARGLLARGAAPVQEWALVFEGKRVHVRHTTAQGAA